MALPFQTRAYETWAPVIGRVLIAGAFLMGAAFKIPGTSGFTNEVAMSAAAGIPFAMVAVFLAFILEVVAGVSLIIGWNTRLMAFLLMLFTLVLIFFFYRDISDPMKIGMLVSHLNLVAGLFYMSVYGAQKIAVKACPLPQGLMKS